MPYYMEACLLRSAYCVTLAVLQACTVRSVFALHEWLVFSDLVTYDIMHVESENDLSCSVLHPCEGSSVLQA